MIRAASLIACALLAVGCMADAPDAQVTDDTVEQNVEQGPEQSAAGPCVTACNVKRDLKLAQCRKINNTALRTECNNAAWAEWNTCVQVCL